MSIILASASPRRKELLEQIGCKFSVVTSNVDEEQLPGNAAGRAGDGSGRRKGPGSRGRIRSG